VPAEESRYAVYYKKFLDRVEKDVGRIIAPEKMAAVVRRALTDRKPRRLYVVNRNRTIRLLSRLPQALLDKMVRKMVK